MRKILLSLACSLFVLTVLGQRTLTGKVMDDKGNPIQSASGATATFSTSLAGYTSKTGASTANNPPVNAIELARQFYFPVTLDDNSTVIAQQA